MLKIQRFWFLVLLLGSFSTRVFSQEMCDADLVNYVEINGQCCYQVNEFAENWKNGEKIRVEFLDGNKDLQNKVIKYAEQWEQYANIDFNFGDFDNADIKITFDGGGNWSKVGTSSRLQSPSMSLSDAKRSSSEETIRRVVLHEFGHALGLHHEHQNINKTFEWNEEAVFARYSGPPNYWSRSRIIFNILKMYGDKTKYTNFSYDPDSIMHYWIDASLTKNGYSFGGNTYLSDSDKQVIGRIYPFPSTVKVNPPIKKTQPTVKVSPPKPTNNSIRYATLLSRRKYDDYARACFSFEFGGNGNVIEELNRNDWDILFGNGGDVFSVDMVVDDQSRIVDLGELNWSDSFDVPVLPAHPQPTREVQEPSVKAVVGHIYLVHTKDRNSDLYALFRVESLEAGDKVAISWKLIEPPTKKTQSKVKVYPPTKIEKLSDANAYYSRGTDLSSQKNYREALAYLTEAINLKPDFSAAYYARAGVKKYGFQDYQGAIEDYSKAIDIEPDTGYFYYARGLAKEYGLGDKTGAYEDFRKACGMGYDAGCKAAR